ncbi:MAG: DUF2231 domain-containing protein [Actinomycetes bacterium]
MFDTFMGLPLHVLLVHFVVVGVPLMTVATVAVAAWPWARGRLGWVVVVLNAGLFGLTFVAKEAGEKLFDRLSEPAAAEQHTELGDSMPWFVLALLVVSVLVPVVRHRRPLAAGVLVLTLLVGGANLVWIYRTGESGSRAVWGGTVSGQP